MQDQSTRPSVALTQNGSIWLRLLDPKLKVLEATDGAKKTPQKGSLVTDAYRIPVPYMPHEAYPAQQDARELRGCRWRPAFTTALGVQSLHELPSMFKLVGPC